MYPYKGPFPLERFTATESSAVVIFTGNDIEEGFSPIERAATPRVFPLSSSQNALVETGL
jgi:hypothetical protein